MSQKTDTNKPEQKEFSKLRRIFWPVYNTELKKVLPMGMIFFCILFNYTCLRNIKDTLVVSNISAEALPFLKGFCVLPAAIVFMLVYAKASNILKRESLFYATITPFIVFFGLFAAIIYPNLDALHASAETIANMQGALPEKLKGLTDPIAACGNWSYSLFYVLAEIWGSAILSLLFWQFANQICRISEARRFYAFFGLMAQVALLVSGKYGKYFSDLNNVPEGIANPWQYSLNWLMGAVVVFGLVCIALYRWMNTSVLTDKRFYDEAEMSNKPKKKKPKMGLGESLKFIFTSPYLMLIATLVIAYGISINIFEAIWKSQIKIAYPTENEYNAFMFDVTWYTGWFSMFMMIVGGNVLRLFRWTTAAIITPLTLLALGSSFFAFILFRDELGGMIAEMGTNPVTMAVIFGATVVIISKSTKYALFDTTKEMAYIPLDDEMKVKGKAVVDVVGGRFGKAGGAYLLFAMILISSAIMGSKAKYIDIAAYIAGVFLVICVLWMIAVKALGKRVDAMTDAPAKEDKAAA